MTETKMRLKSFIFLKAALNFIYNLFSLDSRANYFNSKKNHQVKVYVTTITFNHQSEGEQTGDKNLVVFFCIHLLMSFKRYLIFQNLYNSLLSRINILPY